MSIAMAMDLPIIDDTLTNSDILENLIKNFKQFEKMLHQIEKYIPGSARIIGEFLVKSAKEIGEATAVQCAINIVDIL